MVWTYTSWWAKNKKKENAKRRARYRKDPRYRAKQVNWSIRYYNRERRKSEPVEKRVVVVDGVPHMTITLLSKVIGRKPNSIRKYHRMGIIPGKMNTDRRGWRIYSKKQAVALREAFRALDAGEISGLRGVHDYLIRRW